ncbi:hypothetical protein [Paraburkholderia nemoris]|uniref:hypothetical protein n=1 Tax=Paraburkholderia nemoris TaxID=2793076 RepID=UPI000FFBA22D|nr:hypothetical protein [Paraburkholderia nemoris]
MPDTNLISEKLNLSEDELLRELATGVSKGASATDLAKRGKEIYGNLKSKLQEKICRSELVRKTFENGDRVALVAALLDCVAGSITGVSPVTFCVLLAREGVSSLCVASWKAAVQ